MNSALVILVVAGLVLIPLFLVVFVRHRWLPWALAALGLAVWASFSIYLLAFSECPDNDECLPGLAVFFLGIALLLWLGGIAGGVIAARVRRRSA